MKVMKKILSILVIFSILITNFMPCFTLEVKAEETTVDMSKTYKLYIYYASLDSNHNKVAINSFDSYEAAKAEMNKIDSKAYATAAIEVSGSVIDADYAIVHMDQPGGGSRVYNDNLINIYPTAEAAYYGIQGTRLTYVAGTWGVDAAFLEYNPLYGAYKIKISGVTGWVKLSQVTIEPIATYYGYTSKYTNNTPKVNITSTVAITLRNGPGTSYDKVCGDCYATPGATYTYYPEKTVFDGTYTWYYITTGSVQGYIASADESWVKVVNTLLTDTFYYAYNNNIYHYIHMGIKYYDYSQLIGEAPFYYSNKTTKTYYMKNNYSSCNHNTYSNIINRYLSFDGNYFYTDFKDMIDDYRDGTYDNAINANYPYYAYFMYQPSRTKTSVTADVINQAILNTGITSGLTHDVSYYYDTSGNLLHGLGTESILYNTGQLFINAANTYGVNPLSIYTAAMRESGNGTSAIALIKNNLFGYGAVDGNAFNGAKAYETIADSINEYAQIIGGNSGYTNLTDYRYHGTHKGNKLSGTITFYMSDPYGGEKDSGTTYVTDINSGSVELYSNTLGIKNNTDLVSIYKYPSSTSDVIYQTKNYSTGYILQNLSFIVADKVYVYENGINQGYYKIYTDVPLNENRDVDSSMLYNFNYSYGYIKEEDLYVQNSQPVINASNIEVMQFEEIDLLNNVSAEDYEDGDLTNKITFSGEIDIETPGIYAINYSVLDSSNFAVTKQVNVTVVPSDAPIIHATDIQVPQYTTFDPKFNVVVEDNKYGDITSSLEVTYTDVNTDVIGEYKVTYKAVNEDGIETQKSIVVQVVVNQKPIINVSNITKYIDDSFNPLDVVTAEDYEDGDLTSKITYEGTVDTSRVGEYIITYSVADSALQVTKKSITVTIEEKEYIEQESIFYLEKLLYNEETKKIDFTGFIIIKGMNNTLDVDINYSIIFENQYDGSTIVKKLSRMTDNLPFDAPSSDGYVNTGAWFHEELDLTDIDTGNYNVYVRARSGNSEAKVYLKNAFFNRNVSSKFEIDDVGYQFRTNYFNKNLPIELNVRKNGLVSEKNNPTIDNMYNQLYEISLDGKYLNITASSHNVYGDYGTSANVERYLMFENIETNETYLNTNVGFITNGPYKISLKVDDGFDKTKAWYKTTLDLESLPSGTYSIVVRTITGDIDDHGELYDILSPSLNLSSSYNGKNITITRNKEIRYRIEVTIE